MIRELAEAIHSAERKAVEGGYVLADDGDDLPGYEFRVKDPDFLSEMVESAGLSTAAYLEYGE